MLRRNKLALLREIRPGGTGPPVYHPRRAASLGVQDAPCIDCRPAQPLYRVSPVITRLVVCVHHEARARVYTIPLHLGPRALSTKSKHTQLGHAAGPHRRSLRSSATQRSLAGPASLVKPKQQRWTNPNLKHVDGRQSLGPRHVLPPCVSGFEVATSL